MSDESELYHFLVENTTEGVYFVNRDRVITYWNRGAEQISGFAGADVIGVKCSAGMLNHVDDKGRSLCRTACPLQGTMDDGQPREIHVWMKRADGSRLPVWIRATPTRDADGTITGSMEVFSDDTSMIRSRTERLDQSHSESVDRTTGVRTRAYLTEELNSLCVMWARQGWPFGVTIVRIENYFDLDRQYGMQVADRALAVAARTLAQVLAYTAVVGRYSENEFVVLQPARDAKELAEIASRIKAMIDASLVHAGDEEIPLRCGVADAMIDAGETPEAVLIRISSLLEAGEQEPATV